MGPWPVATRSSAKSRRRCCGTSFQTRLCTTPTVGRAEWVMRPRGKPMPKIVKRVMVGALAVLGIALIGVLIFVAALTFPGTPKSTASLKFAGFIPLPKGDGGLLSIQDYLTVDGRTLYATNESTGAVYEIHLGAGPLPTHVAVALGDGEAHGVVV